MSRHWKPPRRTAWPRFGTGKRLRSLDEFDPSVRTTWFSATGSRPTLPSYFRVAASSSGGRRLPEGAKVGLVLIAAACVGIGIGAYQVLGPRDVVADEVASGETESVAPPAITTAADAEWAARGAAPATAIRDSAPAQVARPGVPQVTNARIYVIDGDTFSIGGERVRIAGIDAPETHPSHCSEEARLGLAATEKLKALLASGSVAMSGTIRDRYGREVRNVQVNGRDVGEAMVEAGVARPYAGGRRPWC